MNYINYDVAIVQQRRVRLVGWPKSVAFVNPSLIGTVGDIRTLRDELKCGQCHWVKLTASQLKAHIKNLDDRREQGLSVGTKRKPRSDKGKKRKRTDDKENEPPKKKRKSKQGGRSKAKKGGVSSVELIEEEEEEGVD